MQTRNLLNIATQNLETHSDSSRIKKLIFCACKQKWENDTTVLSQYPLITLLEELYRNNTRIDDLKQTLDKVVQSLSRSSYYATIANVIIGELGNLYSDSEESTQIIFIQPNEVNSLPEIHGQLNPIAETFAQDENALRIKKLLFCACRNRWENDPQVLDNFHFKYLIQEILESHVTIEQLSETLYNIVETLNRQGIYSSVANTIIAALKTLYPDTEESTVIFSQSTEVQSSSFLPTNSSQTLPGSDIAQSLSPSRPYDSFHCRLEVMKYTNPLRAKVLLFSLLYHPFNASQQDWAIIKTHELDELLYHFFQSCSTFFDFERKLYDMAKRLENPYESTQAASAIAQSIKPYYANC
ncbi:MAG: hypothetical protein ACOC3E_01350 [Cyanobacteriota bacterium]